MSENPKNIIAQDLVCPKCKGSLIILANKEFYCGKCNINYPIIDGVYYFLMEDLDQVPYQQIWKTDKRSSASSMENAKPSIIDFKKNVLGKFEFSGRVLEIGAGLCWASLLLKRKNPGCQVFTSDISLEALKKGKATSEKNDAKIHCSVVCRVERLPFPDNFFDYIFGSSVLIYSDLGSALKELRRVLKVGGCYIGIRECVSSRVFSPFYMLIYARKSDEYAAITQLHPYKEWMKALKNNGFSLYQIDSCKDMETKALASKSWYFIANKVPDALTRNLLFSEIHILMKK